MTQQELHERLWKVCTVVHGPFNPDKYDYEKVANFLCDQTTSYQRKRQELLRDPVAILKNWQSTAAPRLSTTTNLTALKFI